ncbi:MAG: hypothetical protein EBV49_10935 [Betaproteobacteria bacterium]|jgi:lipid-A-disaccharide synthase-like uncharacterized protein|nr:hypothetical protein [Betaproteobacteria bacterium]NDG81526.1 hypothetical protein [Betaproteobacteria bacterium]
MNISAQTFWIAVGFAGQALFSARFLVQWIASERARKSVVPKLFWYFSIAGGATLFAYAVWREDPVFMFGQGFGLIVYVRNLLLIRREGDQQDQDQRPPNQDPKDTRQR